MNAVGYPRQISRMAIDQRFVIDSMGGERMSDQADRLRQLVGARRAAATSTALAEDEPARPRSRRESASPRTTRSLLFTSGKGGVGTSNLVLNLAIALGEMGQRVVVVDADLGLANLDLLCGLTPRYDLGDVLAGRCRLVDARDDGPWRDPDRARGARDPDRCGRSWTTGRRGWWPSWASWSRSPTSCWWTRARAWARASTMLAAAADQAVIVSTPEPTSMADAHAAIGRFRRLAGPPRLRVRGQPGRGRPRRRRGPRPAGRLEPPVPGRGGLAAGDRVRCGPTPTSAWRSAAAGRS